MKEVENNKDLNSVLEKIKADCKRDVKLAADQYEYKDSPEFQKYLEKAKGMGWNLEDPAELKILHAMHTIAKSNTLYEEYGDPTIVKDNLSKGIWIENCVSTIDTLAYGIEEQLPKEVGFLHSVMNIMEEAGKKEQQEIERIKKADQDRIDKEKREKFKAEKLKEEERLAKMSPYERTKEELRALLNKDMGDFVKKIFEIQMNGDEDSKELDAAVFVVRNLDKKQSERFHFEMLYHTINKATNLVENVDFFK